MPDLPKGGGSGPLKGVSDNLEVRREIMRKAFARCDPDVLLRLAEDAVRMRLLYPAGRKDARWYWSSLTKRQVRRRPEMLRALAGDVEKMNMAALISLALLGQITREDRKLPPKDFAIAAASFGERYSVPFHAFTQLLPVGLRRYAERLDLAIRNGEGLIPVEVRIGESEDAVVSYVEVKEGKPRFQTVCALLTAVMRATAELLRVPSQEDCYETQAFKVRHYSRRNLLTFPES
jgi:hypothetical protein